MIQSGRRCQTAAFLLRENAQGCLEPLGVLLYLGSVTTSAMPAFAIILLQTGQGSISQP